MKKIFFCFFLFVSFYAKSQIVSNSQLTDTICTLSKKIVPCKINSETPKRLNITITSQGLLKEGFLEKKYIEWYIYNNKKIILLTPFEMKNENSITVGTELIKASNSFFIGVGLCVGGSAISYIGFYSYTSNVMEINSYYLNKPQYASAYKNELNTAEDKKNIFVGLGVATGIIGIIYEFKAWYHIRLAGEKMNSNSNNAGLFIKPNPKGVSLVYRF